MYTNLNKTRNIQKGYATNENLYYKNSIQGSVELKWCSLLTELW